MYSCIISEKHASYPVDTGRKLNVHKTYIRRAEDVNQILYDFCSTEGAWDVKISI